MEVQTCEQMYKHTNSHFSHASLIADIKVKRADRPTLKKVLEYFMTFNQCDSFQNTYLNM